MDGINHELWERLEDIIPLKEANNLILSDELAIEGLDELNGMIEYMLSHLPKVMFESIMFVIAATIQVAYAFGYRRGKSMAKMPEFVVKED